MRGAVLIELKLHRPYPITDAKLREQLNDLDPDYRFTELSLRQAVDYLSGHGLVEYQSEAGVWGVKITSQGIDYLDGFGAALPGVHRYVSDS
ncbi:MAG TPA: hypothetical protein DIC36_08655 [Gammaproteobacteria bacterium]|nr:hypothetical protein [Gammaproteobacteria bacterium]